MPSPTFFKAPGYSKLSDVPHPHPHPPQLSYVPKAKPKVCQRPIWWRQELMFVHTCYVPSFQADINPSHNNLMRKLLMFPSYK